MSSFHEHVVSHIVVVVCILGFVALCDVEETKTKNGFRKCLFVSEDMKTEYEINTAKFDELIKEYGEKTA